MKKNQFPLPCPLSHPLQTDSLHLLPSTSTMTQRSKSPVPDFKNLAAAAEQLEIQLALAQLALSVLKLQIAAATEEVEETKTKKTYTQATKTTPTVPQISTSSGDLQKEPSSDGDKTQVGQQGWNSTEWTSSWSMPLEDQKPWPTSANTWSTRSPRYSGYSRRGKTSPYPTNTTKKDYLRESSWKKSEDSRCPSEQYEHEHTLMHYSFCRRNRCW